MDQTEQDLNDVILRLNGRAWGIAAGLLLGGGLFLATILLVLRGGPNAGQHLSLLRPRYPSPRHPTHPRRPSVMRLKNFGRTGRG